MKRLFVFLFVVALAGVVWGQEKDAEYYRAQYSKVNKAYAKDPTDVAVLMDMVNYYAAEANPLRNFPLAMNHVKAAEKRYIQMIEDNSHYKEVSHLIKKQITLESIRRTKDSVRTASLHYLEETNNLMDIELAAFAEAFAGDEEVTRQVDRYKLESHFRQALAEHTFEAYEAFQKKYPGTAEAEKIDSAILQLATPQIASAHTNEQIDSLLNRYHNHTALTHLAEKQRAHISFAEVSRKHTVEAYKEYMAQYPSSDDYLAALERIDQLILDEFAGLRTPKEYADFIVKNSENELAEQAMDSLCYMIEHDHNMEALQLYLKRFPLDHRYSDIYRQYYEWVSAEGNRQPIEAFAAANPNFPFPMALEEDLRQSEVVDTIILMDNFNEANFQTYASYVYKLTGKKASYVALQRTLQQLIATQNWRSALDRMEFFSICFETDCVEECAELRSILQAPANAARQRTKEVCPVYDMLNPTLHPNGQYLYYTKQVGNNRTICLEQHGTKARWVSMGEVKFSNAENKNMTFFSFFDNGNKMLLGVDGDVWIATHEGNSWRISEIPPFPVNSDYVETDAIMVPDGTGMLLASDRPNGQNHQRSGAYFHGDTTLATDIYFIPHTLMGWGDPINLGISVNTTYSERSPVLSRDLHTLYFITDGHGGLGYGDIYKVERTDINDWTHWSKPTNMGKEVNTGFNEASISLSNDERTLYISSNASGTRYGCYTTPSTHTIGKSFIQCDIDYSEIKEEVSRLQIADIALQSISENIEYSLSHRSQAQSLYVGKRYLLSASAPSLLIPSVQVNAKNATTIKIKGYSYLDLITSANPVALKAVSFTRNTSTLQPLADLDLEQLVSMMQQHPDCRVSVIVNVPGKDDLHCYSLSLERGEALRSYLAKHGIKSERISISAFGNVNFKNSAATNEVEISLKAE